MQYKFSIKAIALLSFCLLISFSNQAQNIESQIDDILNASYKANEPGATALVYKDGKVIYRKGFGSANLELGVAMQPEHVFEIGSITKQFTAIAILMLEEQGKLKVEDDITKYIPDYPTNGKTITIHNLLNHTSGIKSYTSMESFIKHARTDMTPSELIDKFKNEPMDFDPGEKFLYNNSGYILLGHIIEIITGETYADYIQKHIFDKIGMKNSYYGSMKKLIKNRAYGYKKGENGYLNADYLSLTLPYAAGSLMSNVDDLLKWQKALNTNQLITQKSYEKAINGSSLNNGEHISYGYGLGAGKIQGSKSISHGGGIFGYATMGIYMPQEDVFVSVLTNCDCSSPTGVANKIAALAIGKPFLNKADAITLSEAQLNKWAGAYEFPDSVIRYITVKNGKIFSQREGSTKLEIYPMSESKFIFEEGDIIYNFSVKNGKKQAEFVTDVTVIGNEINKAPPAEQKEITLAPDVLKQYIGKYELQPGFVIEVTVNGNQIFAQATGQPQFEIFAESEDNFFLKVVPAKLVFSKDENGIVNMTTLHQGGQQMPGKKID
ncbi:serine hydrolase [Pontimicrobium sp. SW4]|uniref:Serine hydrolase n=1 Tax=Pontimicrobium sp. SW4 TaxID=3153519 RepID=A0AAU7BUX1_9FLAO